MSWLEALIAGVIQGLTEFLPISSSGHLVIYSELISEGESGGGNLAFTVFLHFATLLAVVLVYRKDVVGLVRELVSVVVDLVHGRVDFSTPPRRYLLMVIIGTIPAVAAGVLIKKFEIESILENIYVVAIMLLVTAILMFNVDNIREGNWTGRNAPLWTAVPVGVFQALAILPGLSRSGSTIFGGVAVGFKKEFAVRFAFILSIPAVLGATIVELRDLPTGEGAGGFGGGALFLGFVAAFFCGVLAIKFIRLLIRSRKFWIFGIYCILASLVAFLTGVGLMQPLLNELLGVLA